MLDAKTLSILILALMLAGLPVASAQSEVDACFRSSIFPKEAGKNWTSSAHYQPTPGQTVWELDVRKRTDSRLCKSAKRIRARVYLSAGTLFDPEIPVIEEEYVRHWIELTLPAASPLVLSGSNYRPVYDSKVGPYADRIYASNRAETTCSANLKVSATQSLQFTEMKNANRFKARVRLFKGVFPVEPPHGVPTRKSCHVRYSGHAIRIQ